MASIISAGTTSGTALNMTADTSGQLQLATGATPTTALTIDTSQNVGIGTTSPTSKLQVNGTGIGLAQLKETGTTGYGGVNFANTGTQNYSIGMGGTSETAFSVANKWYLYDGLAGSMRMVVDTSGNVLVGAASQFSGFVANAKLYTESSTADFITHFRNTNGTAANAFGLALSYSTAPNGTSNAFLDARDSSAQRAAIRSNGGLANFSANNVNLSDERLKTDITPAKSYLDTICSIPVVTFKYNDQTDEELNLGVIAQAVDTVAPELVDHSGFGEAPEGESPYLAIYQTDLQYALMKCIQEQQTIINDLKARVTALEAK